MKTKQLVVAFLLATIFFSCSKSDDAISVPEVTISGNWVLTNYHFEGSSRTLDDTTVSTITFSATAWDISVAAVFSETGNNYTASGAYNLDIFITDENGDEFYLRNTLHIDDVGTWSRSNSFLGITIDGELTQGAISILNDTTLKYVVSSSTNETDENNQNVSVTRIDTFTYTRQAN